MSDLDPDRFTLRQAAQAENGSARPEPPLVVVIDFGRVRLDILGDLVIVLRQATERIREVELPRCTSRLSSMVGSLPVVGGAVHNCETPPT